MGKSKGVSTTVVKNLPDYAEPYVKSFLERAEALSLVAYQPYTDITYATQNTNETDAIERLAARGRDGNPTIAKAITHIEDILDGDYLSGTKPEFVTMLGNVTGKPTTTFENDIKDLLKGSLLLMDGEDNLAQSICTNIPSRYNNRIQSYIYLENYKKERSTQNVALQYGASYAGQSAKDAEILRVAGLYAREYTQGGYEDSYKRWYEVELGNIKRLDILGNAIRAMVGTQEADTTPFYKPNPAVSAMGGALAGAGTGAMIGAQMGHPIYGAAIGAVVGAIAGLVSAQ